MQLASTSVQVITHSSKKSHRFSMAPIPGLAIQPSDNPFGLQFVSKAYLGVYFKLIAGEALQTDVFYLSTRYVSLHRSHKG